MALPAITTANPRVLEEIILGSGVRFHKGAQSYIFTCPKCGKAKKLYIRAKDGRFACWYCKEIEGYQGYRVEFPLHDLTGISINELRERLYGFVPAPGVYFLDPELKDFFGEDDEVPEGLHRLSEVMFPSDYYPINHPHALKGREYVEGRGVSLELAKHYGLRYHPPSQHVIIPISSGGRVYGWQERALYKTEWVDEETGAKHVVPKIVTSPGLKRERCLMFMDNLVNTEHAILCEGPFDAIKAHLCGGAVASMGKAVGATQLSILRNSGIRRLYSGLDPDAAAELSRIARELGHELEVYQIELPPHRKDLGECDVEEVLTYFHAAKQVNPAHILLYLKRQF